VCVCVGCIRNVSGKSSAELTPQKERERARERESTRARESARARECVHAHIYIPMMALTLCGGAKTGGISTPTTALS
jgi:hypothetical protein